MRKWRTLQATNYLAKNRAVFQWWNRKVSRLENTYRICRNKRPGRLILKSNKRTFQNQSKPIGFVYSPLWILTPQNPSVLCTPPFENSLFLVSAYSGMGVYFGKYINLIVKYQFKIHVDRNWSLQNMFSYAQTGWQPWLIGRLQEIFRVRYRYESRCQGRPVDSVDDARCIWRYLKTLIDKKIIFEKNKKWSHTFSANVEEYHSGWFWNSSASKGPPSFLT